VSPDQPSTSDDEFVAIARLLKRHKRERWLLIAAAAAIGMASTVAGVRNALSSDEQHQRVSDVLLWIAFAFRPGLHDFIEIGLALLANALAIGGIAWAILAAAHRVFRSSDAEALRRAGF
jgi:F0F1-type ATP synthase membrane subunit c/vacuolar-type H+-ATPase subunit K